MYFLLVLAPNSPVLVFFCMCLPHVFTHSPVLTAEMYSGSVYSVVFRQARSLKGYPALFLLQPAVTHPLRPFSYHFLSKSHPPPHTHTFPTYLTSAIPRLDLSALLHTHLHPSTSRSKEILLYYLLLYYLWHLKALNQYL